MRHLFLLYDNESGSFLTRNGQWVMDFEASCLFDTEQILTNYCSSQGTLGSVRFTIMPIELKPFRDIHRSMLT